MGFVATTAIFLGATQPNSPFTSKLPDSWYFGIPSRRRSCRATHPAPGQWLFLGVVAVYGGMVLLIRAWYDIVQLTSGRPGIPVSRLAPVFVAWVLPLLVVAPLFSQDVYSYAAQGEMMTPRDQPLPVRHRRARRDAVLASRRPALEQRPLRRTVRSSWSSTAGSSRSPGTTSCSPSSVCACSRSSASYVRRRRPVDRPLVRPRRGDGVRARRIEPARPAPPRRRGAQRRADGRSPRRRATRFARDAADPVVGIVALSASPRR